jgi:hypothetical protein
MRMSRVQVLYVDSPEEGFEVLDTLPDDDPAPKLTRKLAQLEQTRPEFYTELTTPSKEKP